MGRFEPLPTDPYRGEPRLYGALCAACRGATRLGTRFCTNCGALRDDAERGHTVRYATSRGMRFVSRLLDSLIAVVFAIVVYFVLEAAGLVELYRDNSDELDLASLNVATLIGTGIWFLWFAAVAPRGQTPAKQLMRLRTIAADASDAPTRLIWLRESFFQFFLIVPSIVAEPIVSPPDVIAQIVAFAPVVTFVDAAFIFSGSDKQTIHDRIFNTLVVNIRPERQPSAELRAL